MWESTSASKSAANPNPSAANLPAPAAKPELPSTPPRKRSTNPAVEQCVSAYYNALAAAGGANASGAREAAESAFKRSLPQLSDRASIRDFIACVTHGMVLNIFWNQQGPRLVFAARATLAALPSAQKSTAVAQQDQTQS